MKIAVTAGGPSLEGTVEMRFGRSPYFLLIDPDTMDVEALPNPNIALGGGAGPQSAQLMASKGVSVVLTGNCGPNAFRAFGAVGIQVITGVSGPINEAVDQFKAGALSQSTSPNVDSHFGMGRGMGGGTGRGMGGGMGCGMGRGMGGGMGRGMGGGMGQGGGSQAPPPSNPGATVPSPSPGPSGNENVDSLKQMAESMREQLEALEGKIKDMEKGSAGVKKEPS